MARETQQPKHTPPTPGPWDVLESNCSNLAHVEAADGFAVCSIPKKRLADAFLIAAAPDLLAACELLAAWDRGEADISDACSAARAAIARAKGSTP